MAGGSNEKTGGRDWIYTGEISGRFQKIHRATGVVLYTILFFTPWVNVGGHPAVSVDLAARRLFLLGQVFTPRDSIFLVLLLLGAAFTLFFLTSLFGRLWCGYTCPQTVFLEELIRPIERFWEGSRGQRMKADQQPTRFPVLAKKAGKQISFLLVSFVLAMALTSFFVAPLDLWTGNASLGMYGVMASVALLLFFDFTWFREQMCNYICPYARFQGALTDDYSIGIEYDAIRGEPRKKGRRKAGDAHAGSCVDCGKCASVCPQGVDIRNGFQMECINCARCIDACSGVMAKFEQPSLIRYTTIAEQQGRKQKWLRPRTVAYAALLSGLGTMFLVLSNGRHRIEATVNRAPGTLYQLDADGWVRNTFLLQVANNDLEQTLSVTVRLDGLPGAELVVPPIQVAPAGQVNVPLVVRVPASSTLDRTTPLQITVSGDEDERVVATTFKSGTAPLEG